MRRVSCAGRDQEMRFFTAHPRGSCDQGWIVVRQKGPSRETKETADWSVCKRFLYELTRHSANFYQKYRAVRRFQATATVPPFWCFETSDRSVVCVVFLALPRFTGSLDIFVDVPWYDEDKDPDMVADLESTLNAAVSRCTIEEQDRFVELVVQVFGAEHGTSASTVLDGVDLDVRNKAPKILIPGIRRTIVVSIRQTEKWQDPCFELSIHQLNVNRRVSELGLVFPRHCRQPMTGTQQLALADKINELLGVSFCQLEDASSVPLCQQDLDFAPQRLLLTGQTWYERHGWRPEPSENPRSTLTPHTVAEFDELVERLKLGAQENTLRKNNLLKNLFTAPLDERLRNLFVRVFPNVEMPSTRGELGRFVVQRIEKQDCHESIIYLFELFVKHYMTNVIALTTQMVKFYPTIH